MKTCVNCTNEAVYEYVISTSYSQFYCRKDLPKFLKEQARQGLLEIKAKIETKKTKKEPTVEETTPEEE